MNPASEDDLDYGPTIRGMRPGLKLFKRYFLRRQLGKGGMGVVWLAEDTRLEIEVALKFLPDALVHDAAALEDLRRETRRCVKLNHPNMVRVYDLAEGDSTAAIAMEFVDGKNLSELRLERPNRVFDVGEIGSWIGQLCTALAYAHEEAEIVHRDLKPANVMVNGKGQVKVMDFGISSSIGDTMTRLTGAQSGSGTTTGGTLPYMSPQQMMGGPPSVADDVYALGATIYELLTGKPPFFRGDLVRQIGDVVPPSMEERRRELGVPGGGEIPAVWEETVAACLAKDAGDRPGSVVRLWACVNDWCITGEQNLDSPPPNYDRLASGIAGGEIRPSKFKLLMSVVLAGAVCFGGAIVWEFWPYFAVGSDQGNETRTVPAFSSIKKEGEAIQANSAEIPAGTLSAKAAAHPTALPEGPEEVQKDAGMVALPTDQLPSGTKREPAGIESDDLTEAKSGPVPEVAADSAASPLAAAKPVRVTLTMDKTSYAAGEHPKIEALAEEDCHLVLLYRVASGDLTQLFPNYFHRDGKAAKGEWLTISPLDPSAPGKPGDIEIYGPPFGMEQFVLFAIKEPDGFDSVNGSTEARPFAPASAQAVAILTRFVEDPSTEAQRRAASPFGPISKSGKGIAEIEISTQPK